MGVICHGQSPDFENSITKVNNPIYLTKNNIDKIIIIQRNYKMHFSRNKYISLKKEKESKIYNELESQKLINFNKILECKSEIFYKKLISSKKILPYQEIIKNDKKIQKKILSLNSNSITFPFHVIITENKIYKGSWSYNKNFNNYGVLYEFNPSKNIDSRTEGIFEEGALNGFGRIFLSNEGILIGNFIFNKLNGLGEYYRNDGSIYQGGFFDGLPQGNGEEIFEDKSSFKGFYLAGKKKYGKLEWKNGNYYSGDFYDDLFHGYGTYVWGKERSYEGGWKNGKMDGKGKLKYRDGSYYDGEFKEGKKEGKGIYVWNKDKYYEGDWKNDAQNGFGVYYKNKKKIKGFWIDGKLMANYQQKNCYSSPDNKNKTLEIKKNFKTEENMWMTSYDNNKYQTIRSEYHEPNNIHRKIVNYNSKTSNTNKENHIFIPKKIKGKQLLGSSKKIINLDINDKKDEI